MDWLEPGLIRNAADVMRIEVRSGTHPVDYFTKQIFIIIQRSSVVAACMRLSSTMWRTTT